MYITEIFYKNICTDILAKFPNYKALTIMRDRPRPGEVLVCGLNEGFNYVEIDELELDNNGNGSFEISFWLDGSDVTTCGEAIVEDYEGNHLGLQDVLAYCRVAVYVKENKISRFRYKSFNGKCTGRLSKKQLIEEFIKCIKLNTNLKNIVDLIKFRRSFDKDYVYKI